MMSVKLRWRNVTVSGDSISIFRSTTAIDPNNPGEPLAVLTPDTTEYEDTTAVIGLTYYYAVGSTKGSETVVSKVSDITALRVRGPGSSSVLRGDNRLGYMGKLPYQYGPDISAFIGSTGIQATTSKWPWVKLIRKNKIYLIPRAPMLVTNMTVASNRVTGLDVVDRFGLDSGVTWNFDTSGWRSSGKKTIIEYGGNRYYLRAPRGMPDDWDGVFNASLGLDPETEFNEMIQPMLGNWHIANRLGNLYPVSNSFWNGTITCAEQSADGVNTLGRMITGNTSASSNAITKTNFESTRMLAFSIINSTSNSDRVSIFWPILELIED